MNYLRVPHEVKVGEIRRREWAWSPSMYRRVTIPNSNVKQVKDLLNPSNPYEKGVEPGSIHYLHRSTHFFIRTKALQDSTCLIYPKGDAIIPISPRVFEDPFFVDGDILMSKDSNVGECAMVDVNYCRNHMFCGGIVRLHPTINRYYFFSFLKHPIFKMQFEPIPRGATITHAKSLWLDYLIPFPNQSDPDRVVLYVSAIMNAIIEKEKAIRHKNKLIDQIITTEIVTKQNTRCQFRYSFPSINEISTLGRLDASMYSREFKTQEFLLRNYVNGSQSYQDMGFDVCRGQNLQLSCIGKSIYSDKPKSGFYRLAAPTDLSEFRTIQHFRYLGNSKELATLRQGDVIFGAEGFCKGRIVILADAVQQTITNIHGIIFHTRDGNIIKGIYLGCFLGYLRALGLVDAIGAGGSGGSLAIGYFHHVPIPKFSEQKQAEIAHLYHNDAPPPADKPTIDSFVQWHDRWNSELGIWELDREMKVLQRILSEVQEQIIEGKTVTVPI